MEYKLFVRYMDLIKTALNKEVAFNDAIEPFNSGFGRITLVPFDEMITLLEELVGDETQWVSWFIFDNDWGKKLLEYRLFTNDKNRKMKTYRQLWQAINYKDEK